MRNRHQSSIAWLICCILSFLGDCPAYEFYMMTFRNALFHLRRSCEQDRRQSVPELRHIQFRRRGITQKKEYNIQNTANVWNLNDLLYGTSIHFWLYRQQNSFCKTVSERYCISGNYNTLVLFCITYIYIYIYTYTHNMFCITYISISIYIYIYICTHTHTHTTCCGQRGHSQVSP
jgi:hypothetical protein